MSTHIDVTTSPSAPTGRLADRHAQELLGEAQAVTQRLRWLLRDTRSALVSGGCRPTLLAQLDESQDFTMAALAAITLTIKESTE